MASEYLKKKYKDVKPEEKRELTPEERRKNWWHYHKWHVAAGAVLIALAAGLLWEALGIGRVDPDYQAAYVGRYSLPEETAQALQEGLASLGEDLNGDGVVSVRLNQYPTDYGADAEASIASQTALMADLVSCESCLFLLEDPEAFLQNGPILRRLDGSLPEEDEKVPVEELALPWSQCPALAGLPLGEYRYGLPSGEALTGDSQALLSGLYVGRRGFWTERTCAWPEGCDALWEKMTEGAEAP